MMYTHFETKLAEAKYRLLGASTVLMALVASVSAVPLNGSINPILTAMTTLFPSLVDLTIAAIPVIVVIALAAFIVGFLNRIVTKIK